MLKKYSSFSICNIENHNQKLSALMAIPPNNIKKPNHIPVNVYLQEAENLWYWCQNNINKLTSRGWITTLFKHKDSERSGLEKSPGAYEFRDDHIHLIIKTVFAKRYNKLMDRCGPFWYERFSSQIIEHTKKATKHFINLIHDLTNISVRKGYVKDSRDYEYGSFNYYLYKDYKGKLKIDLHDYFLKPGNTFEE